MAHNPVRATASPASASGTALLFNMVGVAESISDIVSLISPADTPCYSTFRKESATQAVHSWQEDRLRAPKVHAVVEGADAGTATTATTGLKQNWLQLFEEVAKVSSSVRASQSIGRGDEMEYQVMKKGKEIKRDIERSLVGVDLTGTIGNASTARVMSSLSKLINSSNIVAAGGDELTEADILNAHQLSYNEGGDPNWLLCSARESLVIANFAYVSPAPAATGRAREVGEGTLYNKVETYISPFGTLSVVTDRFCAGSPGVLDAGGASPGASDGIVFLIDTERCFLPELQPMSTVPLAKAGHADSEMVFTEVTLGLENSYACAAVTGLHAS